MYQSELETRPVPAAAPAGGRRAAAPAWVWAGAYLTAELRHRPWAQRRRGWVGCGMGNGVEERRTGACLGGRACAGRHGPGEGGEGAGPSPVCLLQRGYL